MTAVTAHNIPLQNTRHELYCQNRAMGMSGVDSLAAAGFQRNSDLAHRLDERPEVMIRVNQLRELHRKQMIDRRVEIEQLNEATELGISTRWVLERLKDNVDLAQDAGQFGAAHSTLKTIAELIGMNRDPDPGASTKNTAPAFEDGQLEGFAAMLSNMDLEGEDVDASDLSEDEGEFQIDPLDEADADALTQALSEIPDDDPADIEFLERGNDQ